MQTCHGAFIALTVGLDGDGVTTGLLDHLDGLLGGALGTGVVDNDLLAGLAKLDGDGTAKTTGTSGDKDDLGIVGHHLEGGSGGRPGDGRAGSKGRVGREGGSRGGGGGEGKERGEELHCCLCWGI